MTVRDIDLNDLFDWAFEHYQAGRLVEAEQMCRAVLTADLHHLDSLRLLGVIRCRAGDNALAIKIFRQALAGHPRNPELYNNLGHVLTIEGALPEAVAALETALGLQPDYVDAHNNLGNALKRQGQLSAAILAYQQALTLAPDHTEALNNLGTLFLEEGWFDEAILRLERALLLSPGDAEIHNNLGTALAHLKRDDEALIRYRSALALRPDYLEVHINLGILLAQRGMTEQARHHFARCLEHDPQDRLGARLMLAALGAEPMPQRPSAAFLHRLYASRAAFWDQRHTFRAAELVVKALDRLWPEPARLDILDAGCGTGRVGELVRRRAQWLEGVDLSPEMLAKAGEKGLYHRLHQSDLVDFLARRSACYNVITCAATLIHLGDLAPTFAAAAGALRENGLFIFTIFPQEDTTISDDFSVTLFEGILQDGCFRHSREYLSGLAATTGFGVESWERDQHEYRKGLMKTIDVIALRRQPK